MLFCTGMYKDKGSNGQNTEAQMGLCSFTVAKLCSGVRERTCKNGMKLPKQEFLQVHRIFSDCKPWAKNFGKRECIVILTSLKLMKTKI